MGPVHSLLHGINAAVVLRMMLGNRYTVIAAPDGVETCMYVRTSSCNHEL